MLQPLTYWTELEIFHCPSLPYLWLLDTITCWKLLCPPQDHPFYPKLMSVLFCHTLGHISYLCHVHKLLMIALLLILLTLLLLNLKLLMPNNNKILTNNIILLKFRLLAKIEHLVFNVIFYHGI